MQSKKACRRRAALEYLRHGHVDDLDLTVCIGPKTNMMEWFERRKVIIREVSVLHRKLAGKNSFLVRTLTAEIMLHNVKVVAHNHYRTGRALEVAPAGTESALERTKRETQARAHITKAEHTMAKLEAWVAAEIESERTVVATNRKNHEFKLQLAMKYNKEYLAPLRELFAPGKEVLPDELIPIAAMSPADRNAWFLDLFRDKDRIFSVYAAFEQSSHFA
jgi:hypothetical protein